MKKSIKLLALVLATSFPCVAFAQILGAPVPASLSVENMVGAFSLLLVGLLLVTDYSPRARIRSVTLSSPARSTETHRLAA